MGGGWRARSERDDVSTSMKVGGLALMTTTVKFESSLDYRSINSLECALLDTLRNRSQHSPRVIKSNARNDERLF